MSTTKTIAARGEVDASQKLRIAVDCDLPPGPVDVVVTVRQSPPNGSVIGPKWTDVWGLGHEVWHGVDAGRYVAELREDRGPTP